MGLDDSDPLIQALGADTVDAALDEIRASGLQVATLATVADLRVLAANSSGGLGAGRDFEPGEAHLDHCRQLEALNALGDRDGHHLVLEPTDFDSGGPMESLGLFLTCEGADFLEGRLDRVEEAGALGARSITLVHYRINELGDIQTEDSVHGGLTAFGADVIREMNRIGLIVDLAHATFDLTKRALDVSEKPLMISHSHLASGEASHPRLLSHDHALAVAGSGGLIGAWPAGVELRGFDDYIDEIMRLIDLLGLAHVAIGTDMDANYRPVVDHYGQFGGIASALEARGLSAEETDAVLGGNFRRLFSEVRETGPADRPLQATGQSASSAVTRSTNSERMDSPNAMLRSRRRSR